jgi:hypothetical protein
MSEIQGQRPPGPTPSMRPTNLATLVVAGLATAALSWLLISRFYGDIPKLPWLPPIMLAALAVAEGAIAPSTKARIERQPGREPVDPLLVARLVVLAKASSLAGSLFGGLFAGATTWLLIERQRLTHAADDLPAAVGGLVASILLVVAALWLERSCRIPHEPDGPDESDSMPGDRVS